MFYVKSKICEELSVKVELNGNNVFTTCFGCGIEHEVDIIEMAKSKDFSFYDTRVYCDECSKKIHQQERI